MWRGVRRLSGYVCSCERHGASCRLLAVFSPAASLRLTVSGIRTASWRRYSGRRCYQFRLPELVANESVSISMPFSMLTNRLHRGVLSLLSWATY